MRTLLINDRFISPDGVDKIRGNSLPRSKDYEIVLDFRVTYNERWYVAINLAPNIYITLAPAGVARQPHFCIEIEETQFGWVHNRDKTSKIWTALKKYHGNKQEVISAIALMKEAIESISTPRSK